MFKISDNLHSSLSNYTTFNVLKFLQMKQGLPFWELTSSVYIYFFLFFPVFFYVIPMIKQNSPIFVASHLGGYYVY